MKAFYLPKKPKNRNTPKTTMLAKNHQEECLFIVPVKTKKKFDTFALFGP